MATVDDEDPIDSELGDADPEATAAEAMGTLDPTEAVPGAAAAPPPMVSGQPDQELPPAVPIGAPPAAIAAPAMVPAGTHAVKGTRTVSGMAPNADLVGGQAAEQQVFRDEKKLAADQAELQGKAAQIEQERAEKIAEETARQNAEIMAEQQHQADLAAQRAEQFSRDIDELKRSKPPGGFTEWAGGKKAAASLSIALGGMVAGRTGTANLALADVNREVEQEDRRYQQGIENQFHALAQRQGLNHELDNQAKDALARGQARKVMALDSLNKYADAQLKALGIPAAQQAGIKAQLGFDQQAAQAQQKYGQILGTKVTDTTKFAPGRAGAGGGTPNDALSKLHEFARLHTGPDQEAQVVREAERLFPGMGAKPEKLQALVAGAVKASADAKASAAGKAPGGYTDVLSGQTLPVDASKTDARQHNEATAKLKPINTFLVTAKKLLEQAQHPQSPEWTKYVGADVSGQASAAAAITRLRSAYAAAKGESVGEGNSAHLAEAIPDPPTKGLFNDARMKAWRRKISDVVEEMTDLRKEGLANAGVPLDVIEKVASGKATPEGAAAGKQVAPDGTTMVGPGGQTKIKRDGKWVDVR